jgi:hypothetical protein
MISFLRSFLLLLFHYPLVYVKKLMGNPNSNHQQRGPVSWMITLKWLLLILFFLVILISGGPWWNMEQWWYRGRLITSIINFGRWVMFTLPVGGDGTWLSRTKKRTCEHNLSAWKLAEKPWLFCVSIQVLLSGLLRFCQILFMTHALISPIFCSHSVIYI